MSDQTHDEATEYGRYAPENVPTAEDDLWYIILRLVNQSCGHKDGEEFDSWATSAYERAIMALDDAGFVEIERRRGFCRDRARTGGRIYAKKLPKARYFEAWMEIHDRRDRIAEARHHLATVPGATERRGAVARLYDITLAELDDEP